MEIDEKTLPSLQDRNVFIKTYMRYAEEELREARLLPQFVIQRLVEAHGSWMNDLTRVGENEPELGEGLDHYKQCGHMVFWLRRMSPVTDTIDLTKNLGDAEGLPLTDAQRAYRELLFGYLNEYLAFEFGFKLCKFYEEGLRPGKAKISTPTPDYYRTMCHFLKFKNVSPHAMFLIYKSLFIFI